jgi:isocitrate/isopropylmalate dehydrogenase
VQRDSRCAHHARIEIVLAGDRDVLTPDLGGKGTTRGMGDAILASL